MPTIQTTPFTRQFLGLCERYFEIIRTDTKRLMFLAVSPSVIAMLIAIVAFTHRHYLYVRFGETQQVLFAMVCASIFMGLFNTIQEVCSERDIIKREYLAGLRISAYVLSKIVVQLVVSISQGLVFTTMCWLLFGLPDGSFFNVLKVVSLIIFSASILGLFISSVVRTNAQAILIAPLILIYQLLFAGAILRMEGLSRVISFTTISHWASRLLGSMARLNELLAPREYLGRLDQMQQLAGYLAGFSFDPMYDPGFQNYVGSLGVLVLFCVVFGASSVVALKLQILH